VTRASAAASAAERRPEAHGASRGGTGKPCSGEPHGGADSSGGAGGAVAGTPAPRERPLGVVVAPLPQPTQPHARREGATTRAFGACANCRGPCRVGAEHCWACRSAGVGAVRVRAPRPAPKPRAPKPPRPPCARCGERPRARENHGGMPTLPDVVAWCYRCRQRGVVARWREAAAMAPAPPPPPPAVVRPRAAPPASPALAAALDAAAARWGLTVREADVVRGTLADPDRRTLGARLGLGVNTLKSHVRGLLKRSGHATVDGVLRALLADALATAEGTIAVDEGGE
jgi:DNA-binding CsgD family transcriptional regulator